MLQATALAQGVGEKAGALVLERYYHPPEAFARDWEDRCLRVTAAGLAELERRVQGPWLCGESFSHADVMAFCTLGYLRLRVPEVIAASRIPNLETLEARCAALPAARACPIAATEVMPERA